MDMTLPAKAEVLVVGAGPAGSTAAEHAARDGADVVLMERRGTVGVPVRCGEMMPSVDEIASIFGSAEDLGSLFSFPDELRKGRIESVRTHSPGGTRFEIPFDGWTTDRSLFDQHLASKAVDAGARLVTGCQFLRVEGDKVITTMGEIEADVVIGADGPGSRVARSLGLDRVKVLYPAVSAQATGNFDPICEMFFGSVAPGAYGWIIPKFDGANVGVGYSPRFSSGKLGDYFRRFVEDMGLEVEGGYHGKLVPSSGPVRRTVCDRGLTVGDAAGHVMAVNGGGVPEAMICGRIAGRVAASKVQGRSSLEEYQTQWRAVMWKPLRTAVRTKWLADLMFGSNRRLELSMKMLGERRMGKIIRCGRAFP